MTGPTKPSVDSELLVPIAYAHLASADRSEVARPPSSGPAVAALILGVVSLIVPFLISIPAIFCGIVGLQRRSDRRGFAVAGIVLGIVSMLLSVILLPMQGRPRPQAQRVHCASNLRQLGLAMLQYANIEPNGAFPDRISHLLATFPVSNAVFVCPSSNDTPSGATKVAALMNDLMAGGHDSYIYVGAGLTNVAPDTSVLMYENISHHKNGMNVLFVDGHVEFAATPEATALLALLQSGKQPPPTSRPSYSPAGGG